MHDDDEPWECEEGDCGDCEACWYADQMEREGIEPEPVRPTHDVPTGAYL